VLIVGSVISVAVMFSPRAAGETRFKEWMNTHSRKYETQAEYQLRLEIFLSHLEFIDEHNRLGKTYTVGINQFADMTVEEFASLNRLRMKESNGTQMEVLKRVTLPSSVDWRTSGAVSSIKDQGLCGCCYAFSAAGAIEGAWAIKGNGLASLSPQQIVSCSISNYACEGGFIDNAFNYVISKGLSTEDKYPFTSSQYDSTTQVVDPCHLSSTSPIGATISSWRDISSGSESGLIQAIALNGPVSVGIDASKKSFQLYSSGVYYEPTCSTYSLSHAVLAVGYGTDASGVQYYIVKNTWGTTWGMSGYILMARNNNNNCGIATMASFPVV